ncbi:hypothetical protein EON83_19930 [bacterium]|nr:MAG: hypothetical protein EON83_19930 [bacterium]
MKSIPFLVGALLVLGIAARAQTVLRDTRADAWVATDGLGRAVPLRGERVVDTPALGVVPGPRAKKFVGMFYFLWLGEHGQQGPFDNTLIMQRDPLALEKPDSPLWGPLAAPHHWGQSAFGYYTSHDEWVLRRHAQMLSDAGVDVVIFDVTNQLTYPRSYRALCRVWSQMRREGNKTPQIAFLTPFWEPANVVKTLYSDFYRPGIDPELWFRWQGKPLILADPAKINDAAMAAPARSAAALAIGETLGQSFRAERAFEAIGGSFPTWNTKESGVTLSLYDRVGGKLLVRKNFENVADNATVSLQFPTPLPAGNYYLEQSGAKGTIGWWTLGSAILPESDAKAVQTQWGSAFVNGQPSSGHRETVIRYSGASKGTTLGIPPTPSPEQRAELAREIGAFFTFRKPQASYFEGPTGADQWSWLEVSPQHVFKNSAGEAEQMAVGVAQNAVDGKLSVLSNPRAHGRSFHDGAEPEANATDFRGRNFAEQWGRAMEVDPQFLFVTGWNEWIAGRFSRENNPFYGIGPVSFVDQFNAEFSRDIEPVQGAHGDAYYYQLSANIRRFKGAREPQKASASKNISLVNFSDWLGVLPQYQDDLFDTTPRNEEGWNPKTRYTNTSGRNDFEMMKMARNGASLFAYARTRNAITPRGKEWMNLLIDSDRNANTGWLGFDYRVNASPAPQGRTSVERWVNGGWRTVGSAAIRVKGREMTLEIPRTLLGLQSNPIAFDFKWMDNVGANTDVLNLYRNGDTAPNGRFKYRFEG